MSVRARSAALSLALALASGASAWGARTTVYREPAESLRQGEAAGVALTARGALFPAPRLVRLGEGRTPGEPNQVWSMAADRQGNLFLGTGPEGRIIRVAPSGKQTLHYTVDEPLVSALAIDRNGDLLAGTAPGGTIYRIRPGGEGKAWCETGERYVWSLAVGPDGAIYAGTGEHGKVLKIDSAGKADAFFDGDDAHIVSLLVRPEGGLLAGGASLGLLYEIDEEGHGFGLYEDELPEVAALALGRDGAVLVALVAPPAPETKRPAVQLRLPDGAQVGATDENVGTLEESTGPLVRGFIEGLPAPEEAVPARPRGRLVRIDREGRAVELWSSTTEAPFSLVAQGGAAVFGTGEPARLYRIEDDGDVALLASLREAQITGILAVDRAVFVGTSNPGAAYRLDVGAADGGAFVSRPIDAGGNARWGAIRWRLEDAGSGGRVELYTRTGNSRGPDGTWSAWGPALSDPERSRVINPDGRYLQWRARFVDVPPGAARLSSVSVHYETYNRPPEIRDFRVAGGENAVSGPATFAWSWRDADRDGLELLLDCRKAGTLEWSALPRGAEASAAPAESSGTWSDARAAWDTSALPEGDYEIRASATDRAANDPGEAATVPVRSLQRLVVDRTPPRYEVRAGGGGRIEVVVEDERSEIRRLEVLEGGRVVASLRPADGVCDSRRETFTVELPASTVPRTLRGVDAAGNAVEFPFLP